jgi:protein-S-isoprenylcysteine O-methyltransferase Ste14
MDTELVFRLATFILLFGGLGFAMYTRAKGERAGGAMRSREGQGLLVVLRLFALIAILPLFGYIFVPDWVAWARFSAPDWLRWLAVLPAVAAVPFLVWVHSTIGKNISPVQATRQDHKLITSGPYHYIRHPLYTGGSVFFLALSVITTLWWIVAIGVIPMLIIMIFRTPLEEARLIEAFGDEYRDYMKRTGRFLPKLS